MAAGPVYVTKLATFSAAHRYWRPDLDEEGNRALYGYLAVIHGHTYTLEVTVAGPVDPRTGMVIDLAELKGVIDQQVVRRFDHSYLNDDPAFASGVIPTTENAVRLIWELLSPKLGAERLWRLRLWEDPTFYVEYFGPEGRR